MGSIIYLLFLPLVGIYYLVVSLIVYVIPERLKRKKNIKGQIILITGAGSGLGRQLAVEFSKHATCLILVDINKQSLLQTQKMVDGCSTVFVYECDVSDYKKVYEMAEKVKKDAGDVDILVNNAGLVAGKYLVDLPEDKIVKTMEVNTLAHFWTLKAFLPAMVKRNQGHVVSIASIAGRGGGPKAADYCASKFAVIGLAESLEVELREQELEGIKVSVVCPSQMDTGLFRGAKIMLLTLLSPEYVAKKVVAGVLEEKEVIYIPEIFRLLFILKEIFPRQFLIYCYRATGNIKVMEHFIGHEPESS